MSREELHQSKQASPTGTYTPGYSTTKIAMVVYGLMLLMVGLLLILTPLRLIMSGQMAKAEATQIVKTEKGFPDVVLANDDVLQTGLDPTNYRAIFWNEFSFLTVDGHKVKIRCPIGSRLKPLCPLTDVDGLPTVETIYYNPSHPNEVVFPSIVSTWFCAGALIIIGLLGAVIGCVLFHWANKPIILPHITAE